MDVTLVTVFAFVDVFLAVNILYISHDLEYIGGPDRRVPLHCSFDPMCLYGAVGLIPILAFLIWALSAWVWSCPLGWCILFPVLAIIVRLITRRWKYRTDWVRRHELQQWWQYAVQDSVWWSMPQNAELLIDTCVWMSLNAKPVYRLWFDFIIDNAEKKGWSIVLPKEVMEELDKHRHDNGNVCAARDAREGYDVLMKAQKLLLEKGLFRADAEPVHHGASVYADPVFIPYLESHENSVFFTLDKHMVVAARQKLGGLRRVCAEDNLEVPPYLESDGNLYAYSAC